MYSTSQNPHLVISSAWDCNQMNETPWQTENMTNICGWWVDPMHKKYYSKPTHLQNLIILTLGMDPLEVKDWLGIARFNSCVWPCLWRSSS